MRIFSSKKPILLNMYFIIESHVIDKKSLTENLNDRSKWIYKKRTLKNFLCQRTIEPLNIEPKVGDSIWGLGTHSHHVLKNYNFGTILKRHLISERLERPDDSRDFLSFREDFYKITNDFEMILELEPMIEEINYETIDEVPTKEMFEVFERSRVLGEMGFRFREKDKDNQFWNDWYTKFEEEGLV